MTSPQIDRLITFIDPGGHGNLMEVHLHDQLSYAGKTSFVFDYDGILVTKDLEPVTSLRPGMCHHMSFTREEDRQALAADEATFIANLRLRRLRTLLEVIENNPDNE